MDNQEELDKLVTRKVERRVAKKVLRDISQRVEEINQETDRQQQARKWMPILVVALILGLIALVISPSLLQWLSERLN
ncbi:MAG: hypothetical protein QNJ56_05045 [Gammaproteobacteria bacterium]|nr:hypothetical protein [Gammaproteobacteria bacterium]